MKKKFKIQSRLQIILLSFIFLISLAFLLGYLKSLLLEDYLRIFNNYLRLLNFI